MTFDNMIKKTSTSRAREVFRIWLSEPSRDLGGVKIKARDKLIGSHITFGDLWDKAVRNDPVATQQLEKLQEFPLDPAIVRFSRSIYPYPIQSKYLGQGDPNDAANFAPVPSKLARRPKIFTEVTAT
jgi:hypothetical protein